jgi:hypothetical protein
MVPLLFVVALLVGYRWPVIILVMFPLLVLYGGVWALAPLLIAVIGLVNTRSGNQTVRRQPRTEPEYKAGYES